MTCDKTQFEPDVYASRLQRAASNAKDRGLAGLIVSTGADFSYLVGSDISTHERLTALTIPADGSMPTIVCPATDVGDLYKVVTGSLDIEIVGWVDGDEPHRTAVEALNGTGRVGLGASLTADHVLVLQSLIGGELSNFVLATSVLRELTMIKDAAEIEELAKAGEAIDRVHAQVPALLRAGRTEAEVAADIDKLIVKEGHTSSDFVIVGSGPNGANPHHSFSDRVLGEGEVVVVDIGGPVPSGYRSDSTRTYVVGGADNHPVSEKVKKFYDVLEKAQAAAIAAVKPGVTAESIDRVARGIIADAGYGEYFVHRTGHGIGLSTHEEPFITEGNDLVLQPGMAFSVEPGIYLKGDVGARIEDIVVVTEDGCRVLNNQPRQLV